MSTRSSIWFGESDGKSVHIFWELAERGVQDGIMTAAPVYIAVDEGDSKQEIAVRLPKQIAEALLPLLQPGATIKVI